MERDMAMHEPGTWVIGFESDDEVAAGRKHGDVSSGWIVPLESRWIGEVAFPGAEEVEIVAVEVDWVGCYGEAGEGFENPEVELMR